jgi:hypothetical protein
LSVRKSVPPFPLLGVRCKTVHQLALTMSCIVTLWRQN